MVFQINKTNSGLVHKQLIIMDARNDNSVKCEDVCSEHHGLHVESSGHVEVAVSGIIAGRLRSRSERAGTTISVGRVHRHMKNGRFAQRIGRTAPVYMAGVLDYLIAEVVELSGDLAHDAKKKRISCRHIRLALDADDELGRLASTIIPEDEITSHIPYALSPV